MVSTSGGDEEPALPEAKAPKVSNDFQYHQITPTPVASSSISALLSSTRSETFPIVVVSELVIPAEAYPEHLNRPGGGKDYQCHLCPFRHSDLHSILTHVRKHLKIAIGCPICGKGYQNAASLQAWQRCPLHQNSSICTFFKCHFQRRNLNLFILFVNININITIIMNIT